MNQETLRRLFAQKLRQGQNAQQRKQVPVFTMTKCITCNTYFYDELSGNHCQEHRR